MKEINIQQTRLQLHYDDESSFLRIGLITLATDLTSEHDFVQMCTHPKIRIHVSRTDYKNPVTPENLVAMKKGLAHSAALLPPDVPLKLIYFSCTSGSAMIGDKNIEEQIQRTRGSVPVITPLSAAAPALHSLGTKKLSILTPYTADVAKPVGEYFLQHGFCVTNVTCMGLEDDRIMARLQPATIIEAAKQSITPETEALFISCTALRSAQIAGLIEKETGVPVVTSNQAAVWRALEITGTHVQSEHSRFGQLLSAGGDKV